MKTPAVNILYAQTDFIILSRFKPNKVYLGKLELDDLISLNPLYFTKFLGMKVISESYKQSFIKVTI